MGSEPQCYQNDDNTGLIKKDGGEGLSCGSSMESLLSSAEQSPAGSKSGSPIISSPVTARRIIREAADPSQSPQSPSLVAARTTKLNLLEERLKEEFSGSSRLLM